jgi:hypothetical protein
MPQYNDTERELMALLQQERQRNGSVQAAPAPLPDLDPAMFLSPAAQREMQAVQNLIPNIEAPIVSVPVQASRTELSASLAPAMFVEDFEMTSGWDISAEELAAPSPYPEAVAPDLENLFMGRAMQEIGNGSAAARRAQRLGQDDFWDIPEAADAPRMYEPPPARRAAGGTVVSQRGPGGFAAVPRPVPQAPQRHVAAAPQAP